MPGLFLPPSTRPPLSSCLPPLIMGGAGFSYQLHADPQSLPIAALVKRAFDLAIRAIDTSPYYEPSEQILGQALGSDLLTSVYRREDYILMTKVGRVTADEFDYSEQGIRGSLARSLKRFQTDYLDVAFCHDIEFVTVKEAVDAVGTLFEIAQTGTIRYVGVSGYDLDRLVEVARQVQENFGRPLDVVQNWAQLTLQNTLLEGKLAALRAAGVECICSSSPLAVGLLRSGGVPQGSLGDWHPAPPALRAAVQDAAKWVEEQGQSLAAVALRFAISRARRATTRGSTVSIITGIGTLADLEENVDAARMILRPAYPVGDEAAAKPHDQGLKGFDCLDEEAEQKDLWMYEHVRTMLGPWLDYPLGKKGG